MRDIGSNLIGLQCVHVHAPETWPLMVDYFCHLGCFMNQSPHPAAMCSVVPALTAIWITDQPVPSAGFPWKRYILVFHRGNIQSLWNAMQHVLPLPLQKGSVIGPKDVWPAIHFLIAIEKRISSGTRLTNSYCLFQFQFLAERNQVRNVSFILVLRNMYAIIQYQQNVYWIIFHQWHTWLLPRVALFYSYHNFDIICDLSLNRRKATYKSIK